MEINGITYKRKSVVAAVPARTTIKAVAMMEITAAMYKIKVQIRLLG